MAHYCPEPARTFSEYLLVPNLTGRRHIPENVSLKTPLVKYEKGKRPALELYIPFASAIVQSVSDHNLAIALARCGGISFIYASQPIEQQAGMVREVKRFKAGFGERFKYQARYHPQSMAEKYRQHAQSTGMTAGVRV